MFGAHGQFSGIFEQRNSDSTSFQIFSEILPDVFQLRCYIFRPDNLITRERRTRFAMILRSKTYCSSWISNGVFESDSGNFRAISSTLLKLFFENKQLPDNNHYYFSFFHCHFHMICLNQPRIRVKG